MKFNYLIDGGDSYMVKRKQTCISKHDFFINVQQPVTSYYDERIEGVNERIDEVFFENIYKILESRRQRRLTAIQLNNSTTT